VTEIKPEEPKTVPAASSPRLVVTDGLARPPADPSTEPAPERYAVVTTPMPSPVETATKVKPAAIAPKSRLTRSDAAIFEPVIIKVPAANSKPAETASSVENTGEARPRVIAGAEVREELPATCKLVLSDENVSVINDGGSVGVLVEIDPANTDEAVSAVSSSPGDVDVRIEPVSGSSNGRRFYIIRSVSSTLGLYDITFSASCGKASVKVRVR
jgi:hypothetical protein